jgi:hypothetical protein
VDPSFSSSHADSEAQIFVATFSARLKVVP